MKDTLKSCGVIGAVLFLASAPAHAQYAPTPQKSPRTPVSKEALAGKNAPALPANRLLEGQALVLDSERLRIGDIEVRLFGVVPPLMGASYGPQARAVIDSLSQGSVTCQIKDREKSGSYLASCSNAANADFGLELLRRGLAATARGSLRGNEYEAPYLAAESAAQGQKLGIWSTSMPTAASEKSIREAALKAEADKTAAAKAEAEKAQKEEQAKQEAAKAEAAAKAAEAAAKAEAEKAKAASNVKIDTTVNTKLPPLPQLKPDTTITLGPSAEDIQPLIMGAVTAQASPQTAQAPANFFERYQLLLTGIAGLTTALVISCAVFFFKSRQRKEDLRATAAALRGELMAARSVCQARLSKIAHDQTDKATSWPRIRTLVFQAYVGRLGCLGSELSRQIASIYGMASDYASYYNTTEPRSESASKRQALEALIQYIEEVMPRLAAIESDGKIPATPKPVSFSSVITGPATKPLPLSSTSPTDTPPSGPGSRRDRVSLLQTEEPSAPLRDVTADISKAKAEIVNESTQARKVQQAAPQQKAKQAPRPIPAAAKQQPQAKQATQKSPTDKKQGAASAALYVRQTVAKQQPIAQTAAKLHGVAQSALQSVTSLNLKAPIIEKLSKLKNLAATQAPSAPMPLIDPVLADYTIPDYANLTEEELEALLYAEDELYMNAPCGPVKSRRVV